MALPTVYTDAALKSYMLAYLGSIATTLNLTLDSFAESVNDVLAAYPATTLASATDVAKVRALARVAAVKTAQTVVATWYDFTADGSTFNRSQVVKALAAMLASAEGEALPYSAAYAIGVGSMTYANDPYPLAATDWTANDDSEVV